MIGDMTMIKRIVTAALILTMLTSNAYAYSGVSSWAEKTLDKAASSDIVPESIKNANVSGMIKKGECASLCVKLCEKMLNIKAEESQNPFADAVGADVLKAASLGIVGAFSGTSFNENSVAVREEIADMLARTYAVISGARAVTDDKELFSDDGNISEWARESVYFIQSKNIIHIVGSNKFAPKNLTEDQTRANYANMSLQSVIISLTRMYDMLGGTDAKDDKQTAAQQCLSMIPEIDFGEADDPVMSDDAASISVKNATSDDFYKYVEKSKPVFSEVIYTLEGQNYKAWDGEYTINIVYSDGILTVEVFKN